MEDTTFGTPNYAEDLLCSTKWTMCDTQTMVTNNLIFVLMRGGQKYLKVILLKVGNILTPEHCIFVHG